MFKYLIPFLFFILAQQVSANDTWECKLWETKSEPRLTGQGHSLSGALYMNNFGVKACLANENNECDDLGSYIKISVNPRAKFDVSVSSFRATLLPTVIKPGESKLIEFHTYFQKNEKRFIDLSIRACTKYSISK